MQVKQSSENTSFSRHSYIYTVRMWYGLLSLLSDYIICSVRGPFMTILAHVLQPLTLSCIHFGESYKKKYVHKLYL